VITKLLDESNKMFLNLSLLIFLHRGTWARAPVQVLVQGLVQVQVQVQVPAPVQVQVQKLVQVPLVHSP
jgi:hypothetical protein